MLKRLVIVASIVSVAFFWAAFGLRGYLHAKRDETLRRIRPMFALSGVTVRLDRHVKPTYYPSGTRDRYLLVMSSDRCPYSQAAVDYWLAMLRDLPFGANDEVLLLSASGTVIPSRLAAALKNRRIEFRIFEVNDPLGFAQETGLGVTPLVAVLDSRRSIRIVSSRLTPSLQSEVRRYFSGGGL